MSNPSPTRLTVLGCVAILAVQGGAAWWAISRGDGSRSRLEAVAFAAAVTGSGALAGWLVARWSRGKPPGIVAAGGLAATALRLLPPLVGLAWLTATDPTFTAAGAGGLLVGFYLSMLMLAIVLHIAESRGQRSTGSGKEMI